jgi:hypothetical protein
MEAARRLRWNNFRWVRDLSTVHFTADNVFRRVAVNDLDWLDLAQVVRNRIAHNSEKAKHQYKRALNKLVDGEPDAALPPGFAPGRFLIYPTKGGSRLEELALDDHFWGDVFEGYISLWERLANHLCPEAEAV